MNDGDEKLFQQQRKQGQRWRRRILRFLLFLLVGLIIIIGGLYLSLHRIYSTEKLKQMAIAMVAEGANRRLEIGDAYLHFLRGFIFNEVRLSLPADTLAKGDVFPLRYAYFKKIELKYSLRQILKRKIVIRGINFQSPELDIFVDMETPSAIDFAALLKADLGLNVFLQKFSFQNAKMKIVLGYAHVEQNIFIGHLNCYLDHVNLPRGGIASNDSLFTANIKVISKDCPLILEQVNWVDGSSQRAESFVDFTVNFDAKSFSSLSVNLDVLLHSLALSVHSPKERAAFSVNKPIFIDGAIHADARKGTAQIDSLRLGVEGVPWVCLTASFDSIFSAMNFSVQIEKSQIPLTQILELASLGLPTLNAQKFDIRYPNTYFSIAGTKAQGSLAGDIGFTAHLKLVPTRLRFQDDSLFCFIDGFALNATAQGSYGAAGLHSLDLTLDTQYDTLNIRLGAQDNFFTGNGYLSLQTMLNQAIMPRWVRGKILIKNILGGELYGECHFKSPSSLNDLTGDGFLRLGEVDLNALPEIPVKGDAAIGLDLSLKTLRNVHSRFTLSTGSLIMPQEDESLVIPPIQVTAQSQAAFDSSFQAIKVDTLQFELNRIIHAQLGGLIVLGESITADLHLSQFSLNHQALMEFLPEIWRERWGDPQWLGTTHLDANMNVKLTDQNVGYRIKGHLFTRNTSFYAPAQYLALVGLNLGVDFAADSQAGGQFRVRLELDSLKSHSIGTVSFTHNRLQFIAHSKNFTSLALSDGLVEVPDLFVEGQFSAKVESFSVNPQISAHLRFKQDARDTLRLPNNIQMIGKNDLQLSIVMDSTIAEIQAQVLSDGFSLYISPSASIHGVNAQLLINQAIDVQKWQLITNPGYTVVTPSSALMDYFVYRGYYKHDPLPISKIHIGRINFADYRIDDINIDLFFINGRLEIPLLRAKLYDGNIAGRMALNFNQGDLSQAEYTINAHFTNINSNLILPRRRGEKQKGILNGNLDLQGVGLDPEAKPSVQGQIYFTEIGPRVADNILRSLDPQGKDSGIRTTRLLINRGFKPKLMTFILRHGYLYPTILFNQPWYWPVRLSGGKVELARIPIEFFLESRSPTNFLSEWQQGGE